MENKKKDMYLQVQAGKATGWSMKAVPVTVHHPEMPAPVQADADIPTPTAASVPMPMPTPMPTPMPMPVPMPEPEVLPVSMPQVNEALHMVLAMSYVPMQQWQDIYEGEEGFGRGTIFAELDLPFMGKGACRHD